MNSPTEDELRVLYEMLRSWERRYWDKEFMDQFATDGLKRLWEIVLYSRSLAP